MVKKMVGLKVLILPLALAVSIVGVIFYVQPVFSEFQKNRKEIQVQEEQLAAARAQAAKLEDLKKGFETMEEKNTVSVALPEEKDTEDYLNELYQRAARSGVIMSDFSITESSTGAAASSSAGKFDCSASASTGMEGAAVGVGAATSAPAAGSVPAATGEAASPDMMSVGTSAASVAPAACAKSATAKTSIKGNWDQILSFLKYLTDSNRVANLKSVSISAGQSGGEQGDSDILSIDVELGIFFKTKSTTADPATIGVLTGGAGFSQKVIDKLKSVIYATYEPPQVSESGERNIFK
jgi:Tfp pilus assembly protein PilO